MSNRVLAMLQSNDLDAERLADVLQSIVDVMFQDDEDEDEPWTDKEKLQEIEHLLTKANLAKPQE